MVAAAAIAPDPLGTNTYRVTSTGGFRLTGALDERIAYVEADLHHVAHDNPQQTAEIPEYLGQGVLVADSLLRWNEPAIGRYDLGYRQVVSVRPRGAVVHGDVPYPFLDLPADVQPYLLSTKTIDADDPLIRATALELAQGYDDAFTLSVDIARWVTLAVNYSLSSLTAQASQPASWVLRERIGVCDEIASLYAALLRSLGIPVRFVYGISYTTPDIVKDRWGPHGWVEVYFPGEGWVPFDPTYGQYGWIDATHIALGTSQDPDDPTISYRWSSTGAQLATEALQFKVDVLKVDPSPEGRVDLEVTPAVRSVAPGSWNSVRVRVHNQGTTDVATMIRLNPVQSVRMPIDTALVQVRPVSSTDVTFLTQFLGAVEPGMRYTIPLTVTGDHGEEAFSSYAVEAGSPYLDASSFQQFAAMSRKGALQENISLRCTSDRERYVLGEKPRIDCILQTGKGTRERPFKICAGAVCKSVTLGASSSERVSLSYVPVALGLLRLTVTASDAKGLVTIDQVGFSYVDLPTVNISLVTIPPVVGFHEMTNVSFLVSSSSVAVPRNLAIRLQGASLDHLWQVPELRQPQKMQVVFTGASLRKGDNSITIAVDFIDDRSNPYHVEKTSTIALGDLSAMEQVPYYTTRLGEWLLKLFK